MEVYMVGTLFRTCFSMGDFGVQVSVRSFVRPSTFTMGVLWAQLPLQFFFFFFFDLFETLQMFAS